MTEDKECRELEPCPFCGEPGKHSVGPGVWREHHVVKCGTPNCYGNPQARKTYPSETEAIAAWNRRAAKPAVPAPLPSPENVRELAEEYCDVREEYERDREWRFNYSGLQNFAVALLSAAPPLPVAQGVPDIGAIWEQSICEVEAGIKLAELRPNQIPGLFRILRRNVEAKLAAAPKEPT